MTLIQEDRKERKKIRHNINEIMKQSCEDCPLVKGMSQNIRYVYCGTECAVGQKLQGLGNQLLTLEDEKAEWTEEEDYYMVHHFSTQSKNHLAKKLGKSPDQVLQRYKFLSNRSEMTRGQKLYDF